MSLNKNVRFFTAHNSPVNNNNHLTGKIVERAVEREADTQIGKKFVGS